MSRGLGDVYKRQTLSCNYFFICMFDIIYSVFFKEKIFKNYYKINTCSKIQPVQKSKVPNAPIPSLLPPGDDSF